jgi:hypothetical protein
MSVTSRSCAANAPEHSMLAIRKSPRFKRLALVTVRCNPVYRIVT